MRVEGVIQGSVSIDEVRKLINPQVAQQDVVLEQVAAQDNQRQIQISSSESKNQSDFTDKNLLKDPEELKKLMKDLQSKLSYLNSHLKIEIDSEINQPIVKIMDINTNQVIRQIPPDYMINIIKNINKLLGVLFEEKV